MILRAANRAAGTLAAFRPALGCGVWSVRAGAGDAGHRWQAAIRQVVGEAAA